LKRRNFLKKSISLTAGLYAPLFIFSSNIKKSLPLKKTEKLSNPITEDFPTLLLEGSARKRGQIHGESLRSKIQEIIANWKDYLHNSRHVNPDKYIGQFIEDTNFLPSIKKWTPNLLDEVKGIAEGADIDFKTIYAFQLLDEEWLYGRTTQLKKQGPASSSCSSLGIWKQADYPALQAQNMDIPDYSDGFQILLHVKHSSSSIESYIFSYAGLIILNGMNNRPIGVCCNTLSQLNHSAEGLPVAFILRGILEQPTQEEAIKFIHEIKHASGQNYIIGGKEKVFDYECSTNKICQFIPYQGARLVYHTNHPLVNDDQSMYKEFLKKTTSGKKKQGLSNSEIRFQSLQSRLKYLSSKITVEKVKSILSAHDDPQNPVCRHKKPGGGSMTIGCTIMVLSSSPEFHLAPGPPCMTKFKTFKF